METLARFIRDLSNNSWFHFVTILLVCYVAFLFPMQWMGLPSGFDMLTHVRFAASFQDAFTAGQFFPSWGNDNFGYGSVGIRFYPPISAYLLAITQVFTNDWILAYLINLYFWMCVGCLGVYLFVKDWGTPRLAWLAAVAYAIIPHHLAEIFQFFLYAEFAAWAVIPFCFLFVSRICRNGSWSDTVLFAISFSILILTHIPTTVIVSFCLPLYVLLLVDWSNWRRIFLHLISAVALTLLATAFRWVMLINEVTWLAHNGPEHYTGGFYDFSIWLFPNIFTPRSQYLYIMTSWLFDVAVVLTVALLIPAVISLFCRDPKSSEKSARKMLIASLTTALFAFFMLSKASFYVWENLLILQKIQFPSRWMSVLSFFTVIVFSLSIGPLMLRFSKVQRLVFYPALATFVAISIFDVSQIIIPSAPLPRAEYVQIDYAIHAEQIWKGWWPIWAKEEAFKNTERVVAGNRKVEISDWKQELKEFVVQPGEPINIGVQLFYYPLWKATVNGRAVEIGKDDNGVMTIPIAGEASTVRLYFEEPLVNNAAYVVSAFTWLVPLFLLVFVYSRKYLRLLGSKPVLQKEYDFS